MPDFQYISDLVRGQDPRGPLPTEEPHRSLCQSLQEAQPPDRPAILLDFTQQNNGDGEELIRELVALQSETGNLQERRRGAMGRLISLNDLLGENFEEAPGIVGTQGDWKIVRGEGHLIVGSPGVGKTLIVCEMAIRLALGANVFGFPTPEPVNVLLCQAELPMTFLQHRFMRMVDSYDSEYGGYVGRNAFDRIHIQEFLAPIDLRNSESIELIAARAREVHADVVIIDPFLAFFRGDENSNSEVRATLDNIKYVVGVGCKCSVIITDHLAKGDPGKGARARGAGAKIDWASLVINLDRHNTQAGQQDVFLSAKLEKVRYGWDRTEPIILSRDRHTLRHTLWVPENGTGFSVLRQLIADQGGEVRSQIIMLELIQENFNLGARRARTLLDSAVEAGIIETGSGPNRAITYRLPTTQESERVSD